MYCVECGVFIKAAADNNTGYRKQYIENHVKTKGHRDLVDNDAEYNAIFNPIQKERIALNLFKSISSHGMTYTQIQKDSALQEIIALSIEAQVGQRVNRASIRALLPSASEMAQKVPKIKKRIDGEYFSISGVFLDSKCSRLFSDQLKKYLPLLAERGEVSLVTDHKSVIRKQGDRETKCLGLIALVTDKNGVQDSVLLDYLPTNFSNMDQTVPMLNEIMMRFGLMPAFLKAKIPFSIDGAMVPIIKKLFRSHHLTLQLYTYCHAHNLDNIIKRMVLNLLDEYLDNGTKIYKSLQSKITSIANTFDHLLKNTDVHPINKNKVNSNFEKHSLDEKYSWRTKLIVNSLDRADFIRQLERKNRGRKKPDENKNSINSPRTYREIPEQMR